MKDLSMNWVFSGLLVFWLVICASCTSGKAVDRWLQLRVLHPPSPQQVPIVSRECDVSPLVRLSGCSALHRAAGAWWLFTQC